MTIVDAWDLILGELPENMGYEGEEVEECAEFIDRYNEAIGLVGSLVKKSEK